MNAGVTLASAGLLVALALGDVLSFYLRQFDSIVVALFHLALLYAVSTLRRSTSTSSTRRLCPEGITPPPDLSVRTALAGALPRRTNVPELYLRRRQRSEASLVGFADGVGRTT